MTSSLNTHRRSRLLLVGLMAVLAALSVLAVACGGGDDAVSADAGDAESAQPINEPPEPAPTGPPPTPTTPPAAVDNTDLATKPVIVVPDDAAPSDLVVTDIVPGDGAVAEAGDFAIMQYVGVSYSTGLEFDASWDRGQPFTFLLGQGQVIAGWDEGIVGMAAGGRRELVIPPDQAYGSSGSGSGSIGPDETLIFVVDLVGIVSGAAVKPEVTVPESPATELGIEDLVEGSGAEVEAGSIVWVHYVGASQSTGEEFDASWNRGIDQFLTPFPVGGGHVIPGWDEGLLGMKAGGRRELVIPPELAYGEAGAGGGVIAPNETLVFVIDLIAVT